MRVDDDRHPSNDWRVPEAGLRAISGARLDVALEIPQPASDRSYFARLNQNDAELTGPVDQNRIELVASQRSTVSVGSIGTGRQFGYECRGAVHPANLLQFWPGTTANGCADA
jgi:hypothetical protein